MPVTPKLWSVSLITTPEMAEILAEMLGEEALALTVLAVPRQPVATVEALYDAPPDLQALTAQITVVAMLRGVEAPSLVLKEMPKLDWLKKVAEDFPPLPVARWIVHGAQHRAKVPNRRHALQIDATNAFGTGEHPTTRGCLMMLDGLIKAGWPRGKRLLDVGCGSGILAMAFVKEHLGTAIGVDMDPASVEIARNNARMNGLTKRMRISIGRGYHPALVKRNGPYDLIMANIFARPLCHMAREMKRHLRPGGLVILSGILNYQANTVLAAHRLQKIHLVRRIRIGEWSVLVLRR